jgi:protein disulfide-isomerase A6
VSGFPTIKFFPAKSGKLEDIVEDYDGGRDGDAFVNFLNSNAGTSRTLDGGLLPSAGRLQDFDSLARDFLASKDKKGVLAEAQDVASSLPTPAEKAKADVYLKIMGKILEKGDAYVAKELARVTGMISSESIAKSKKTELQIKKNVLDVFSA